MDCVPEWPLRPIKTIEVSSLIASSRCVVVGAGLLVTASPWRNSLLVHNTDTGRLARSVDLPFYGTGALCSAPPSAGTVVVTDGKRVLEVRVQGDGDPSDTVVRTIVDFGHPYIADIDTNKDVIATINSLTHVVTFLSWKDSTLQGEFSYGRGRARGHYMQVPLILTRDGRHVIIGDMHGSRMVKLTLQGIVVWTETSCCPEDIAEAADGSLFTVSFKNGLAVCMPGKYVSVNIPTDSLVSPRSLAVSQDGRLFVGFTNFVGTPFFDIFSRCLRLRTTWIRTVVFMGSSVKK